METHYSIIDILVFLLFFAIPTAGVVFYFRLLRKMRKEEVPCAPKQALFAIFFVYASVLMVVLTAIFGLWSCIAEAELIFIVLIAPAICSVMIWRYWRNARLSKYHRFVSRMAIGYLFGEVIIIAAVIIWNRNQAIGNHVQWHDYGGKIEFSPKSFHEVDVNYTSDVYKCSPYFNHKLRLFEVVGIDGNTRLLDIDLKPYSINTLQISAPQKIIFKDAAMKREELVFPVCIFNTISNLRKLKYHDKEMELHLRNMENDNKGKILSGFIYDTTSGEKISSPWSDEMEEQQKQKIEKALKLTDKELDNSSYYAEYCNINLLAYIDLPVLTGKYEVWITYYGLESNHLTVKLISTK